MSSTTASYLHNYHPLHHTTEHTTPATLYYHQQHHNQQQQHTPVQLSAGINANMANITEVISINSGASNTILTPLAGSKR